MTWYVAPVSATHRSPSLPPGPTPDPKNIIIAVLRNLHDEEMGFERNHIAAVVR